MTHDLRGRKEIRGMENQRNQGKQSQLEEIKRKTKSQKQTRERDSVRDENLLGESLSFNSQTPVSNTERCVFYHTGFYSPSYEKTGCPGLC